MAAYSDKLTQRKQEAVANEAALVAHFGPQAENCANWDRLWQRGWQEVLANPVPTATYQPKGLPPDGLGGWVAADGKQAGADPPSLYSDKFTYCFARHLADDEATLAARVSEWLAEADELDCDQLSAIIGKLATYLANYRLYNLTGTGRTVDMGQLTLVQQEAFFENWRSIQTDAGLFVTRLGISLPDQPPIPADVASSTLQAVKRRIKERRKQLEQAARVPVAHTHKKPAAVTLAVAALIQVYEGRVVNRRTNAEQLAMQYGHTSGDKLYQTFCDYSALSNRTGFDDQSYIKGRNMIRRIQQAIPHLSNKAKQQAESEICIIRAKIE